MKKISIRLTRNAAEKARNMEALKKAAVAAIHAAGEGDIHFAPIKVNGQQFALSSRTVVEVDWLPNRVPNKVLLAGEAAKPARPRRRD
jgi:hypothetical protein